MGQRETGEPTWLGCYSMLKHSFEFRRTAGGYTLDMDYQLQKRSVISNRG